MPFWQLDEARAREHLQVAGRMLGLRDQALEKWINAGLSNAETQIALAGAHRPGARRLIDGVDGPPHDVLTAAAEMIGVPEPLHNTFANGALVAARMITEHWETHGRPAVIDVH